MPLSVPQIIFIFSAIVLILLILAVLLYKPISKAFYKKNYISHYGKMIYQFALYHDYYLINELILPLDGDNKAHIDHILFGEKFIYVIKDRYYNGPIEGKEDDQSWIYYRKKNKKEVIDNPLLRNMLRVEKLSIITGIDRSIFISIVIINDDALVGDFAIKKRDNYLVRRSKFKKLVEAIESRNVGKINDEQLSVAVKDIARINDKFKSK